MPTVLITHMPLPIELVAKIVNSYRISKSVSNHVSSQREQYIPTLDQVAGWFTGDTLAISLSAYKAFYISRGCNAMTGLGCLLDDLSTSQMDIRTVCAWIEQLQSELRLCSSSKQVPEDELRDLLARLIDVYKLKLLDS